ncbi:MAG TPA: hypothetical protein VG247_20850 [Pseudonocardiaceae bacterium]|nr:hypothetical protein [Pseudonocardiaceae bacterium]
MSSIATRDNTWSIRRATSFSAVIGTRALNSATTSPVGTAPTTSSISTGAPSSVEAAARTR